MSPGGDQSEATHRRSGRGEPTCEIATLFPLQGDWSEAAYLDIPSNRLLELNEVVWRFFQGQLNFTS